MFEYAELFAFGWFRVVYKFTTIESNRIVELFEEAYKGATESDLNLCSWQSENTFGNHTKTNFWRKWKKKKFCSQCSSGHHSKKHRKINEIQRHHLPKSKSKLASIPPAAPAVVAISQFYSNVTRSANLEFHSLNRAANQEKRCFVTEQNCAVNGYF